MGIIEMVEWERKTYKDIGNILIFMFGGILIAIHWVTIVYWLHSAYIYNMHIYQDYFKNGIQGKVLQIEGKLDKNELSLAYCQTA